ncbi:ferrous iron transport protein A [Clostridiales bacterium]|nr:ferrous iron transport protein A [Clostridiales bacterium]
MTLDKLSPGKTGQIVAVNGLTFLRKRLLDLGFTPGGYVRVRKAAPFGGPIQFCLRGCEIALRSSEARMVAVKEAWK